MGCTSAKQSRRISETLIRLPEKIQQSSINNTINEISRIVTKLESTYSNIINELKEIPEKLAMLSPSELLHYLQKYSLLDNERIIEIQEELKVHFQRLAYLITKATNYLTDPSLNIQIDEQKKNILLTFIVLYEKTCQNFFSYLKTQSQSQYLASSNVNTEISSPRRLTSRSI